MIFPSSLDSWSHLHLKWCAFTAIVSRASFRAALNSRFSALRLFKDCSLSASVPSVSWKMHFGCRLNSIVLRMLATNLVRWSKAVEYFWSHCWNDDNATEVGTTLTKKRNFNWLNLRDLPGFGLLRTRVPKAMKRWMCYSTDLYVSVVIRLKQFLKEFVRRKSQNFEILMINLLPPARLVKFKIIFKEIEYLEQ